MEYRVEVVCRVVVCAARELSPSCIGSRGLVGLVAVPGHSSIVVGCSDAPHASHCTMVPYTKYNTPSKFDPVLLQPLLVPGPRLDFPPAHILFLSTSLILNCQDNLQSITCLARRLLKTFLSLLPLAEPTMSRIQR